ncbi:hypothetical protein BZG36_03185 [Bifiguratus adelaidae]|uniref:Mitochondrial thiamine pyrophosphate carrier 1 n=1 Tax=Bifiguratus adelaidae TaxID=1938954 RepID=A0A261XYW2_9FUNG|nr:hypothetical protein BZG36_03185 [Bifiguratus adelaidae]
MSHTEPPPHSHAFRTTPLVPFSATPTTPHILNNLSTHNASNVHQHASTSSNPSSNPNPLPTDVSAAMSQEDDDYDYESLGSKASALQNATAGALAGIAEHTVMYPVDSIKTRMQVLNPTPQAVYNGVLNAFSRITVNEGARTLWRGINSVMLGAGPAHALYFAIYEQMKDLFVGGGSGTRQLLGSACAGAFATIAHDGLMNPFDVVKQRMQIHGSTYRSVFECARQVYTREGLRAFYISYPTTLTMNIPFQSIQFASYEYLRKWINPRGGYDPLTHVLAGGGAGALAAAVTTPLDVVKTLLQTRGTSTDLQIRNCSGLKEAFGIIWERHGLKGLYRGMKPRVLSHMPSTAISWSVYEYFKWVLIGED